MLLLAEHNLRQVFQVNLMDDAGAWRYYLEIVESLLAPAQKLIAFAVAFKLQRHVLFQCLGGTEIVDHDRMVNDQLSRCQRVNFLRIPAQLLHGIAHGSQIDHRRYAGKILHDDPRRGKRNFRGCRILRIVFGQRKNVLSGNSLAVFVPEQIFQQNFQRIRQAGQIGLLLEGIEPEDLIILTVNSKGRTSIETVLHGTLLCYAD